MALGGRVASQKVPCGVKAEKLRYQFCLVSGGRGQTLPSGAQRQDKGQRAQTGAEEAPAEPEEELLPSEGAGALAQAAQEAVESPSLEIFQPPWTRCCAPCSG